MFWNAFSLFCFLLGFFCMSYEQMEKIEFFKIFYFSR